MILPRKFYIVAMQKRKKKPLYKRTWLANCIAEICLPHLPPLLPGFPPLLPGTRGSAGRISSIVKTDTWSAQKSWTFWTNSCDMTISRGWRPKKPWNTPISVSFGGRYGSAEGWFILPLSKMLAIHCFSLETSISWLCGSIFRKSSTLIFCKTDLS